MKSENGNGSGSDLHYQHVGEKGQEDGKEDVALVPYEWEKRENEWSTDTWMWRGKKGIARIKGLSLWDWVLVFVPCLKWLPKYPRNFTAWFPVDLLAGIAVALTVVPQGMSYANSALLPNVFGLYGAFVPVMVYSFFGHSPHLGVGPVAVTSLLIQSQVSGIVPAIGTVSSPNNPTGAGQIAIQQIYNTACIQIAFIVSIIYILIGFFRLGFLTNFFSHSVIGGFTSGAAVTISVNQLKYILGLSNPSTLVPSTLTRLQDTLQAIFANINFLVWSEFIMGISMLMYLIAIKETAKHFKTMKWLNAVGPISAAIIAIVAVYIGNLSLTNFQIRTVTSIPSGPPPWTTSIWFPMPQDLPPNTPAGVTAPTFGDLLPVAIVVLLVDILESTSIARAMARKNGYKLPWNAEIVAVGLANLFGAATSCYTTTGSFSRSSLLNLCGSKTPLAGFVTSITVLFVFLFLTSFFAHMPYNTMAAIVIAAVSSLFEYEQAIYLFRVNKLDFLIWIAAFCGVIFYSVELGLGIAIGMAVLIAIYETAFPNTCVLGRIPGTTIYRNRKQYRDAQTQEGILAVRVDAPIYFANVNWLNERFDKYISKASEIAAEKGTKLQYFVLDATPITHMDATGTQTIEELIVQLAALGIQFVLVNPSHKVLTSLERAAVTELFGREWIFVRTHDAVSFCKSQLGAPVPSAGREAVPSLNAAIAP